MSDDLFVAQKIDQHRSICISTLARSTVQEADAAHLGGDRGYFIYEVDERPMLGGISVLAKAASLESAFRLIELWQQATQQAAPQTAR